MSAATSIHVKTVAELAAAAVTSAEIESAAALLGVVEQKIEAIRADLGRKRARLSDARRERVDADGEYRFSDKASESILGFDIVWCKIGAVGIGHCSESECAMQLACENKACRFRPEGVAPARHTPLYHVALNRAHTACVTLCQYCRPDAYKLVRASHYYSQNCDDGYGSSKKDFYAQPFLTIPVERVVGADERTRALLLALAEMPR